MWGTLHRISPACMAVMLADFRQRCYWGGSPEGTQKNQLPLGGMEAHAVISSPAGQDPAEACSRTLWGSDSGLLGAGRGLAASVFLLQGMDAVLSHLRQESKDAQQLPFHISPWGIRRVCFPGPTQAFIFEFKRDFAWNNTHWLTFPFPIPSV